MKKMMKQMGIDMEEIEAEEVIIRTRGEDMIFRDPSVTKISARGIETFQISGKYEVIERKPEINEDDVKLIMEQANVSEDVARRALEEASGDLAEALMRLQGG
jgi:nascent polypeptide-associated complex subunit alpha